MRLLRYARVLSETAVERGRQRRWRSTIAVKFGLTIFAATALTVLTAVSVVLPCI